MVLRRLFFGLLLGLSGACGGQKASVSSHEGASGAGAHSAMTDTDAGDHTAPKMSATPKGGTAGSVDGTDPGTSSDAGGTSDSNQSPDTTCGTLSDANNCGTCGHACAADGDVPAACVEGACTLSCETGHFQTAADSTSHGCTITDLAIVQIGRPWSERDNGDPKRFLVDDRYLYYYALNKDEWHVWYRAPLWDWSDTTELWRAPAAREWADAWEQDADNIYISQQRNKRPMAGDGGIVVRIPKNGDPVKELPGEGAFNLYGHTMFIAETRDGGRVLQVDVMTGDVLETFDMGLDRIYSAAGDDEDVFAYGELDHQVVFRRLERATGAVSVPPLEYNPRINGGSGNDCPGGAPDAIALSRDAVAACVGIELQAYQRRTGSLQSLWGDAYGNHWTWRMGGPYLVFAAQTLTGPEYHVANVEHWPADGEVFQSIVLGYEGLLGIPSGAAAYAGRIYFALDSGELMMLTDVHCDFANGETDKCDGTCINRWSDHENCGACGHACASGETCEGGECTCGDSATQCGDVCADLNTDVEHCGACDSACSKGKACVMGLCCAGVTAANCDGTCADLDSDPSHCGSCDNACDQGVECSAGACQVPPPPPPPPPPGGGGGL